MDPCSLIHLSSFAFLCEAFVGVIPSMALLCHFFSLELASEMQCSGCASLKIDETSALEIPCVGLLPEVEGFRRQWVPVEVAVAGALFQPPPSPATPKWGWERERIGDSPLAPVLTQLALLTHAVVSMALVVHEFICRRIAPLHQHSLHMWAYAGPHDSMRTLFAPFSLDVTRELLHRLTGGNPDEVPPDSNPLYLLKAPNALTAEMPLFDEWGSPLRGENISGRPCPWGSPPRRP
ncbi:hypothetical protein D1007_26482 [Hordeum vulgare]|nr:hypothetical protein D1007_26482 [Hordeum vulgare]